MLKHATAEPDPWKCFAWYELRFLAEQVLCKLRGAGLDLQLWMVSETEFILSYRTPEFGHRICTNLTNHAAMRHLVSEIPYGMDTVFVFLNDVGWLLDFYHFDLHSMKVYSWFCSPENAPTVVQSVDVTKINTSPSEQSGLDIVLGPERQLWDTASEPVRQRFVFHKGADFQGYLCLRKWFEPYWDVELWMMAPSADATSYLAVLETAYSAAKAAGGEIILSMVPDHQDRLLRAASKGTWKEIRQEIHIYRPVQA